MKRLSLLLMVVAALVVAGCGGGGESSDGEDGPEALTPALILKSLQDNGYYAVQTAPGGPLYTGKRPVERTRAMKDGVVYWAVEFRSEAEAGRGSEVPREICTYELQPENLGQCQVEGPTFFYSQDTTGEGRALQTGLESFAISYLTALRRGAYDAAP